MRLVKALVDSIPLLAIVAVLAMLAHTIGNDFLVDIHRASLKESMQSQNAAIQMQYKQLGY